MGRADPSEALIESGEGRMDAICVEGLTKYYGDLLAVDHVSFTVHQGEVFGFLGPNGAGKTTTQRMLTTLLEPTEGRIAVFGHDYARDAFPAKRHIGLVPEESNVYTELTAWENLMFTARLYRVPKAARQAQARELLESFGLWEKRHVKAESFSKGMRRRLSIAMALIHRPSLLFLDEPTPGLDVQSTRAIHELIRRMNAEGRTIFLTTHQIEEASQLCDRVAIINHGRIAAIDTPESLKRAILKVQSIEVAFNLTERDLAPQLRALDAVRTVAKMGDKWRLYTEDPSRVLISLLDFSRTHDLRVVSLCTLAPSLEDVFLEITGREVGSIRDERGRNASRRTGGER